MEVIIDKRSGFCFGVKKAINLAEQELAYQKEIYCLGDIVHNEKEVTRLENTGLKVIGREDYFKLNNCKVLLRAHGEPPEIYSYAKNNNIQLIDGTCPVVLKLQEKIKRSFDLLNGEGTIVIFGNPDHPEVIGLQGQINGVARVVLNETDIDLIDFDNPVILYSQTTMSKERYWDLKTLLESRLSRPDLLEANDTICGQVANRAPGLKDFSTSVDAVIFVGGKHSSNSKVLFSHCKSVNSNSFFISGKEDLHKVPLLSFLKIGICGATSTPAWLMEEVAEEIRNISASDA